MHAKIASLCSWVGLVLALCSCTKSLSGAQCPCAPGWTCCQADDTCYEGSEVCLADRLCGGASAPDCGAHGQCTDEPSGGVCRCDEGYESTYCHLCSAGFVAEGSACLLPCDSAQAPRCGEHGRCVVDEGEAACACDEPYAGDDCTACSEGHVLTELGTCELPCGPCEAHASCADTTRLAACACVTGYRDPLPDDELLVCEWRGQGENGGGIVDTGFDDPEAWQSQGATYVPDAFGMGDGGYVFESSRVCEDPYLSQVIQMPPRDDAEPFVLVLSGQSRLSSPGGCQFQQLVQVGESEQRLYFGSSAMQSARLCLGAAGYGPDVRVALLPEARQCPENCISFLFGGLSIERAAQGECPPDALQNPNFDEQGGWTLLPEDSSPVTIADGALNLTTSASYLFAGASQRFHVPSARELPNAALRVRYENYVSYGRVLASLDGVRLFALAPGGMSWRTRDFCIPREFKGTFRELSFASSDDQLTNVRVDSVSLVSTAACADEVTGVQDPGLEERELAERSPWRISSDLPLGSSMVRDETIAHGGSQCFRYTAKQAEVFEGGTLEQLLRVPVVGASQGLRVEFYQRADLVGDDYRLQVTAEDALRNTGFLYETITATPTWQRVRTACLPRAAQGRLTHLVFDFDRRTGESPEDQSFYVDDVRLVAVSDCE
jgi:hypothetical protein